MHSSDNSAYIHGSSSEEQERLSKLNELLNQRCLDRLALQAGDCILDIGSGLGQLTRSMARMARPGGKVIGIERDSRQMEQALHLAAISGEEDLVDFRLGEATSPPLQPSEWGSFDWVHTRFVLEHLPNPRALLDTMYRACRPTGQVVLIDDDHAIMRPYPPPSGFSTLWQAYLRSYDRLGNDPYIGHRLVSLLHEAGLRAVRCDMIFFGSTFDQEDFQAYADNLVGILEGAKELILRQGLIEEAVFEHGIQGLHDWRRMPDATLWYSMNWACGTKL